MTAIPLCWYWSLIYNNLLLSTEKRVSETVSAFFISPNGLSAHYFREFSKSAIKFSVLCTMFRTEIPIIPSPYKIGLESPLISVGSCFADRMGSRLASAKFLSLTNPFGILFNPLSICSILEESIKQTPTDPSQVVENQGVYYHYNVHSEIFGQSKQELMGKIDLLKQETSEFLQIADWLIITLGTAWIYERKDTGQLVANCHKIPQTVFNKRLLNLQEIESGFESLLTSLRKVNPYAKILLTVSPVRHTKETFEGNSVSKALLRVACENLKQRFPEVHYFPSYEIMMDDLRDYRFYEADMIHPSAVAEDYIWDKFVETFFEDSTIEFIQEWDKVRKSLLHKPFHPNSTNHKSFLEKTLEKLQTLHAIADMTPEIAFVQQQLKNYKSSTEKT
ncbi:GSCFA domain-containing protein [Cytophagales bacterium LB-30]|uniref:GSCFA domain-containing protein n=1 Tax=Shiella aurantiaca TaxID=3058365 RepID=A0ABT8F480_9BACT|nr:GSCFA domain-containing protein [Shiella aurantiaca]MDN4165242.1 GSCFA domain-containing protein [Shiella aurantiaca]